MKAREPYLGWSNYETWNVVLWLRNDEPLYVGACEAIQSCNNAKEAGTALKKLVEANVTQRGMKLYFGDIPATTLRLVKWTEVGDAFITVDTHIARG